MPANTTNKNLQEPANGSFNNDWDQPVNSNWSILDTSLGGNTLINVTGVSGSIALTTTQYQPPNIAFVGTLTSNVVYVLPPNVGGIWSILNNTTGAFTVSFAVSGGGTIVAQQGQRSLFVCDGINMSLADTAPAAQAEAFATAADAVVLSSAESFASSAAATAQNNSENFSRNGANIALGTISTLVLPLIGKLQGVIIQADPGGTPSGAPGTIWFYY